jgi:hypothetical protein
MSKPPLGKDQINALASASRGKIKSSTMDETVRQDLAKKGLIQDKLGSVSLTARGKMTLQRKTSVRRGRGGGGGSGGLV